MGRVDGKVAFITGAARGQGRSHAVRLAEEGADIIAVDVCRQRRDGAVRDGDARRPRRDGQAGRGPRPAHRGPARPTSATSAQLAEVVAEGVAELGHIDVVVRQRRHRQRRRRRSRSTRRCWQEMIDINLTGVWKTIKAAVPPMIERGQRRLGHHHQLGRRAARLPEPRPLRRGQARRGRADAHAGAGAGAAHDPRQHGEPDDREHADGDERRVLRARAAGPRATRPRRHRRGVHRPQLPARSRGSSRSTSATPCCGWRPTRPATSPAWRSPSTPGSARRSAARRSCSPTYVRPPPRWTTTWRPAAPSSAAASSGATREVDLVLAAVSAGRDLLLEGPPGTSKSTILRAITDDLGHPAAVRRGQRRAHAGQARRPPQPGPRAARGLQRRQLRAPARWCGHAARRLPLHRGAQPGARGHAQRACSRRWPSARSRCRGSGASRPCRASASWRR